MVLGLWLHPRSLSQAFSCAAGIRSPATWRSGFGVLRSRNRTPCFDLLCVFVSFKFGSASLEKKLEYFGVSCSPFLATNAPFLATNANHHSMNALTILPSCCSLTIQMACLASKEALKNARESRAGGRRTFRRSLAMQRPPALESRRSVSTASLRWSSPSFNQASRDLRVNSSQVFSSCFDDAATF